MSHLTEKQRNIVRITYWTTLGDLENLRTALAKGLDQNLTVNEIKEVLVHTYAYAGFPRALNGINTFLDLINDRQAQGIYDKEGRSATLFSISDKNAYGSQMRDKLTGPRPTAAYAKFVPVIDDFLKEHLFADLFARDTISHADRELVTISVLAALGNVVGQLKTHMTITYHLGIGKEALADFQAIVENFDKDKGVAVSTILTEIE